MMTKDTKPKDGQASAEKPGATNLGTERPRVLHYGDCLDIVRTMEGESVDLIYLDPPFNSKANYNMLFGSEKGDDQAQIQAFTDTWYWHPGHEDVYKRLTISGGMMGETTEALMVILGRSGMLAYLLFMMERLIELKRVLKKTGSIYLHCDPTASHYLKIVMDSVFGSNMFRNEVIWHYRRWTAGNKNFQRMHDVVFRYTKSDKFTFNVQYEPYGDWIEKDYKYVDEETGKRWRWHTVKGNRYKVFLDDPDRGVKINDVWMINHIGSTAKERLGYPTQKPLALLERIIKASSNEGDFILDPFCGCGTSVDAAESLGRRWIGVDISTLAINVILDRLRDVHGKEILEAIEVMGTPRDVPGAERLFTRSAFEFERWAVGLLRGRPNDKQTGDGGSDGTLRFPGPNKDRLQRGVISVKGGRSLNPSMVRDLHGTIEKDRAQIGVLITLTEPSKGMIETANKYGLWEDAFTGLKFPRVQIITIGEILAGKKPDMPTPLSPYVKAEYAHSQQEDLL